MHVKRFLSLTLIPLNSLLLFFLLVEHLVVVPVWLQVFGRMHPLLLHFPIVLTLTFVVLVFVRRNELTSWFLLLAAITSAITALMGFFLARDGGYEPEAIAWHKWTGVLLSFFLFLIYSFRKFILSQKALSYSVALLIAIFVTAASHFGGEITHGENFVLQPVSEEKIKIVPPLEEALVFADLVRPVIEQKCLSCHNSRKAKGELIMETRELLLAGGKSGPLWDSTEADLGLMMKRIHLPLDDKKHMPPVGKPQLTDDELVILEQWIRKGADFDQRVIELDPRDSLFLVAKKMLKPSAEVQYDFSAADEKLVSSLRNNNRLIEPIAIGSPALKVSFYNRENYTVEAVKELGKIAKQITELNLINMPVEDEDLKHFKVFTNLRKLYLNFTHITGKTLGELQVLPNLRTLSLTGTKVDFASLRLLQEFPKLSTVYLWGTTITDAQIGELTRQDRRIVYQSGFSGDTLVMQLTPPIIENEEIIIHDSLPLLLRHNIPGTEIRFTIDGSEPDSLHSPVYEKGTQLTRSVWLKCRAFRQGWISSDTREQYFFKSTYTPDTIILETEPEHRYKASGSRTLYDNVKSDLTVLSYRWLGYQNRKFSALVVLDSMRTVQNVTLSILRDINSYIFPPTKVEIWGGTEPGKMKLLKIYRSAPTQQGEKNANLPVACDFAPTTIKYLRVVADPLANLPSWHPAKGERGHLFIDEMFIN